MFKPRSIDKIKKEKEDKAKPLIFSRRQVILLLVTDALFLLLALLVIPAYYTSRPIFYEQYYADQSFYQAWKVSTHAQVACTRCHVAPGIGSKARYTANSIFDFYVNYIAGSKEPRRMGPPDNISCEQCHSSERIISATQRLIIPHQMHVDKVMLKCVDCHKWLVHQENPEGNNTPSMRVCYRCHNNRIATAKCEACHRNYNPENPKGFVPENHVDTVGWRKQHGKTAIDDQEYCNMCHFADEKFCSDRCHGGVQLPHDQKFKVSGAHGKVAEVNRDACIRCHGGEQWCADCHHPATIKSRIPWKYLHPQVFKLDRQACFNCHSPHYCAKCHIRGGNPDAAVTYPPVP